MVDDVKWFARKRVFIFMAAFLLLAMFLDAFAEGDILSHAVDEIGLVAVSLIMLAFIALTWSRRNAKDFATQRLVLLVLVVIGIAVQVYGLFAEQSTADFGDDIPVLIGLVLMLINGLV